MHFKYNKTFKSNVRDAYFCLLRIGADSTDNPVPAQENIHCFGDESEYDEEDFEYTPYNKYIKLELPFFLHTRYRKWLRR